MGFPSHAPLPESSFSRTRESRFVPRRISLDTRFRGYDGTSVPIRYPDHPRTDIFEGGRGSTMRTTGYEHEVWNKRYPNPSCLRGETVSFIWQPVLVKPNMLPVLGFAPAIIDFSRCVRYPC